MQPTISSILVVDDDVDTCRNLADILTDLGYHVETAQDGPTALERIRQGTYGRCESCGQDIARERLKAIPYTPLCIDCARKADTGGTPPGADAASGAGGLRLLTQLFARPVWLLGGAVTAVGGVLNALALHWGTLAGVQAITTLSLVIALPFGVWLTDQRITGTVWAGACLLVAGIVLFVAAGSPQPGTGVPSAADWLSAGLVSVVLTGTLARMGRGRRPALQAVIFGMAAGVGFGLASALTKAVHRRGRPGARHDPDRVGAVGPPRRGGRRTGPGAVGPPDRRAGAGWRASGVGRGAGASGNRGAGFGTGRPASNAATRGSASSGRNSGCLRIASASRAFAASGTLSVADVDDGQAHAAAAAGSSALGSWSVGADGHWSYAVNNAAVQHLALGATAADSFLSKMGSRSPRATHACRSSPRPATRRITRASSTATRAWASARRSTSLHRRSSGSGPGVRPCENSNVRCPASSAAWASEAPARARTRWSPH